MLNWIKKLFAKQESPVILEVLKELPEEPKNAPVAKKPVAKKPVAKKKVAKKKTKTVKPIR